MIQVPGYLIRKEIGKGGMATVWLAVQASLEREVALKVMQPTLANDPNFSRRFLQEARTLASLSHPNIVAVYDVGVTDAQLHYFSMQHLPGGDFADRIAKGIPEWEVVRVLSGIGRALAFAHHRGFIHRDVSPANVLFDASENPILTDFGIARAVTRTSRLTNAGVSVGTSQYMSPEQARGGDVDTRSDIYSLGCVAYEGLTGKPPYQGEDGFAIAYAHVFEPVPRLPEHLARWQPLIDKALAKSPTDRFTTVDEFVAMLDEIGSTIEFPAGQSPTTRPMQIVTPAAIAAATAAAEAKTDPLPEAPTPVTAPAAAQPAPATARTTQPTAAPKPAVSTTAKTTVRQSVKLPPPPAATPKPAAAAPAPGEGGGRKTALMIGGAVIALAVLGTLGYLGKQALTDPEDTPASSTASASSAAPAATATPSTTSTSPATSPTAPSTGTIAAPVTDPNAIAGTSATHPNAPFDPNAPLDPNAPNATLGPDGEPVLGPDVAAMTPDEAEALRIAVATTANDPLATVLAYAKSDLAAQRYANPPGRNALERYRLAEKLAAKFKSKREGDAAREGIVAVASGYVELAEKRLGEGKEPEFLDFLKRAEEIGASLPEGASVVERVRVRRAGLRDEALARGKAALETWDKAAATAAFERALVFDPNSKEATAGLKTAKTVGDPGYRFRDEQGPELVVADVGGKRLAVARTETTVAEFQRYWSAQGSRTRGGDRPGCRNRESIALFGTGKARTFSKPDITQAGNHPVVCVSQADAADYAKWLSQSTGKKYRLPTAAEWSALARGAPAADGCGGNVGDAKLRSKFNERDAFACDDGFAETAKVGSFKPSGPGVYDIVGNVREWVSDNAGKSRIAMGIGWASGKDKPSPTQRTTFDSDVASNTVGFRVVREID